MQWTGPSRKFSVAIFSRGVLFHVHFNLLLSFDVEKFYGCFRNKVTSISLLVQLKLTTATDKHRISRM